MSRRILVSKSRIKNELSSTSLSQRLCDISTGLCDDWFRASSSNVCLGSKKREKTCVELATEFWLSVKTPASPLRPLLLSSEKPVYAVNKFSFGTFFSGSSVSCCWFTFISLSYSRIVQSNTSSRSNPFRWKRPSNKRRRYS